MAACIVLAAPRTGVADVPEPRGRVVACWGEASAAGGRVSLGNHSVVVLRD